MQVLSSLAEGGDDNGDDNGALNWNEWAAKPIPRDLLTALTLLRFKSTSMRTAQFLNHTTINGLIYTPTSKHKGNSCILLKTQEDQIQVPAQIKVLTG